MIDLMKRFLGEFLIVFNLYPTLICKHAGERVKESDRERYGGGRGWRKTFSGELSKSLLRVVKLI